MALDKPDNRLPGDNESQRLLPNECGALVDVACVLDSTPPLSLATPAVGAISPTSTAPIVTPTSTAVTPTESPTPNTVTASKSWDRSGSDGNIAIAATALIPTSTATTIPDAGDGMEKNGRRRVSGFTVLCCFVLGAGLELPYNAFITAFDYFHLIYPGRDVEFVLTLAFDPTALAGFILGLFYLGTRVSLDVRVMGSLLVELLSLVLVIVMPYVGSEEAGFIVIVLLMATVGVATAFLHLAVFGIVAPYGNASCNALMTGVSAAGLIMSILRIVTKAVFPDDLQGVKDSTILFFILAAAWIVACCGCYVYLRPRKVKLESGHGNTENICVAMRRITKAMGCHHVVVLVCFSLTYIAFPGMLSIIHSDEPNLNRTGWFAVILVALYNFCNCVSSWAPNKLRCFSAGQSGILLVLSCLRSVFPIVFGLCAFAHIPISDAVLYVLVIIFGLSQGYLSSLSVMLGTELSVGDEELAGEMMSFALTIGIMAGSVIAFIISQTI